MEPKLKLSAALSISIISAIGILLQILSQLVIAYYFGTGRDLESYFIGFAVPSYALVVLVFCINTSFVPHFLSIKSLKGELISREFGHTVLAWVAVISLVVVVVGILFRSAVVSFLFRGSDLELINTASALSVFIWPTVLIGAAMAVLSSRRQAEARFYVPAFLQLLNPFFQIAFAVTLTNSIGIRALAIGNLVGNGAPLIILLMLDRDWLKGKWHLESDDIRKWFRSAGVLFSGNVITRFTPVIERMAASTQPAGSIAELNYANRIIATLGGVISSGIGITGFTRLSDFASRNEMGLFRKHLLKLIRITMLIVLPIAIIVIFQGKWIVSILLLRGKFSGSNVEKVYWLLISYLGYFIAGSVGSIVGRGLYAMRLNTIATVLDSLGVAYYGIMIVLITPYFGIIGVALSFSLYYLTNTAIALFILLKKIGYWPEKEDISFVLKIACSVLVMIIFYVVVPLRGSSLINVIRGGAAFGVFVSALILLRVNDLAEIFLLFNPKTKTT